MKSKSIPDHQLKRLEYIGIFLRELRLNEGMSQSELCNLNRNTISRAENARNITLISLLELADALQISPNQLFIDIE